MEMKLKKLHKKLLTHNMIHFLGSDNHRVNTIYKHIPEALKLLEKWIGQEKTLGGLQQIIQNIYTK